MAKIGPNFWLKFGRTVRPNGENGRTVRVRPNHVLGRSVVHYSKIIFDQCHKTDVSYMQEINTQFVQNKYLTQKRKKKKKPKEVPIPSTS